MPDDGASGNGSAQRVPSGTINRTLHVLVALGRARAQTLTEVSRACGLTKATTLRFLRALEVEGFAKRNADGEWSLTTLIWELACAAIDYDHTSRDALGVLQEVVDTTGESAVYALYEDGFTVYVEQVSSPHAVRTHIALGSRVRATATATGKCMLAFQPGEEIERILARDMDDPAEADGLRRMLTVVRRDGHAFNRDGIWRNVWGVAAPVANRHGQVIAAIGVSGPADRQPDDLTAVIDAVRRGAEHLTRLQGGTPAAGSGPATGLLERRRAGGPSSPEEEVT